MIGPEKELLIATLEFDTFLFVLKHGGLFFLVVEGLNAVRSWLKSRDEWKINFRDLHGEMYSGLWKSLLGIKKVDEALFAAEQGRVQTLSDN